MKANTLQMAEAADGSPMVDTERESPLHLRCPVCGHSDQSMVIAQQVLQKPSCSYCGFTFVQEGRIWKALTPTREESFQQFMIEYETIRLREGRGTPGARFYLELPYRDITGRNSWQWKIRSRSFRFFYQRILPWLEYRYKDGLDVLDVGSGNCWLSYRLALRGHRPVAVDLIASNLDGLGAAHHYFDFLKRPFDLFQAEMDRLPFDNGQFDVVVFNSSFHYSENYVQTLQETLRCLRRPGHILIIDSPFYQNEESGQKMLEEKHLSFQNEYGFRSDSVRSREYLTPNALLEMASACGIEWKQLKPWYGVGWALRPLKARLLRRREPAEFYILWAKLGES
ncbi:MAG TPA: class I SAM-dependent methyltransferase [Terriglobia bacterium]|nr:class I SAM-dependent methyltransferase [Terriglobia bacterium]